MAGVWRSRARRPRSSPPWRGLQPYSAVVDAYRALFARPGIDYHHAGVAVDDDPVVLPHQLAGAAGAHHRRDVHAAGHDRRMRVAAADVGDEAGEHALLELQHVGRRQVVGDDHQRHVDAVVQQQVLLGPAPARRRLRRGRGDPFHVAQDALGHLLQVRLALAQVLVLHLVELARQHFELRRQRPLGVVEAVGDPVLDAADQFLVLQQHQVHVQQGGELVRRLLRAHLGDGVLQPVDLLHHGVAAGAHPVDLGGDLARLDEVMRHVDAAGRHEDGAPDGDAAGDRKAVHREGHVVSSPTPAARAGHRARHAWE